MGFLVANFGSPERAERLAIPMLDLDFLQDFMYFAEKHCLFGK